MHATTSAWPACMARSSGVAPPSDRNSSIVATAYLECATATREALRHFCNAGGSRFTGGRGAAGRSEGLCMAAQLPACKCLCTGCCQLLQLKLLLTSTISVDLGNHEALLKYKLQNMRVCLKEHMLASVKTVITCKNIEWRSNDAAAPAAPGTLRHVGHLAMALPVPCMPACLEGAPALPPAPPAECQRHQHEQHHRHHSQHAPAQRQQQHAGT